MAAYYYLLGSSPYLGLQFAQVFLVHYLQLLVMLVNFFHAVPSLHLYVFSLYYGVQKFTS